MNYFDFQPQNNKKLPLYEQLYRFLISSIQNGSLKEGEKLPSKRQMADLLKISINTIENAYGMLVAEGYIKARPKSGYFVCAITEPVATKKTSKRKEWSPPPNLPVSFLYDFHTGAVDTTFFPYATWAKITKEIMADNRQLLNHGHPQGDSCLREALCQQAAEMRGIFCQPEQIIVGAGSEYLLSLMIQILPTQSVFAMENPGYGKNYHIIRNHGRKICPIPLDSEGMQVEQLAQTNANIAYITPSHQFPMGMVMPINRRMQLLHWACEQKNRYLIEDDYDGEFRFHGRPIPALKGLESNDKVIYCSTFSKSFAPSIRIAYMILPETLLAIYKKNFSSYACSVSRFEQHVLYRFLKEGHYNRHLNRMRTIYRGRKEKLTEELRSLPQSNKIMIIGENAGLHLLLQIGNGMNEAQLVKSAAQVGVRVYGLSQYCPVATPIPSNWVVLGYAALEQGEIEAAVRLLAKAWFE